ncbi:MAG: hypothetical protein LBH02_03365, partial [Methanocalculaceae archaeon]|nr:hypothetical protein [Methanocalculaceae archaeon]
MMFEGLKKKLGDITKMLSERVESALVTTDVETDAPLLKVPAVTDILGSVEMHEITTSMPTSVPSPVLPSSVVETASSLPTEKTMEIDTKKPGFFSKLKVLVVERELVLSKKDIDE